MWWEELNYSTRLLLISLTSCGGDVDLLDVVVTAVQISPASLQENKLSSVTSEGRRETAATLLWKFLSRKATTKWWETWEVQPAKIFQSAQTDGAEYSTIWYLCHYGIMAALIDSFYSLPPRCHKDTAKSKKCSY